MANCEALEHQHPPLLAAWGQTVCCDVGTTDPEQLLGYVSTTVLRDMLDHGLHHACTRCTAIDHYDLKLCPRIVAALGPRLAELTDLRIWDKPVRLVEAPPPSDRMCWLVSTVMAP